MMGGIMENKKKQLVDFYGNLGMVILINVIVIIITFMFALINTDSYKLLAYQMGFAPLLFFDCYIFIPLYFISQMKNEKYQGILTRLVFPIMIFISIMFLFIPTVDLTVAKVVYGIVYGIGFVVSTILIVRLVITAKKKEEIVE